MMLFIGGDILIGCFFVLLLLVFFDTADFEFALFLEAVDEAVLLDSFLVEVVLAVTGFGLGVVFLVVVEELLLVDGFGERNKPLLLPKSCPYNIAGSKKNVPTIKLKTYLFTILSI